MAYVDAATLFSTTHVDLGDTPGYPAGTKAVGFGEVLTSRNTNRITYALALNLDDHEQRIRDVEDNTLDDAYRAGVLGDPEIGRHITVDGGAVELNGGESDNFGATLRLGPSSQALGAMDTVLEHKDQYSLLVRVPVSFADDFTYLPSSWPVTHLPGVPTNRLEIAGDPSLYFGTYDQGTFKTSLILGQDLVELTLPTGEKRLYRVQNINTAQTIWIRNVDGTNLTVPPLPAGTTATVYRVVTKAAGGGDGTVLAVSSPTPGEGGPLLSLTYHDESPLRISQRILPPLGDPGREHGVTRFEVLPHGGVQINPHTEEPLTDHNWGGVQVALHGSGSAGVTTRGGGRGGTLVPLLNGVDMVYQDTLPVEFGPPVGSYHLMARFSGSVGPKYPGSAFIVIPDPSERILGEGLVFQIVEERDLGGYTHVVQAVDLSDISHRAFTTHPLADVYLATVTGRSYLRAPTTTGSFSGQTDPGFASLVVPTEPSHQATGIAVMGQRSGNQFLLKGLVSGSPDPGYLNYSGQDEVFLLDNEGSFYAAGSGWVDGDLYVDQNLEAAGATVRGDLDVIGLFTPSRGYLPGVPRRYLGSRGQHTPYASDLPAIGLGVRAVGFRVVGGGGGADTGTSGAMDLYMTGGGGGATWGFVTATQAGYPSGYFPAGESPRILPGGGGAVGQDGQESYLVIGNLHVSATEGRAGVGQGGVPGEGVAGVGRSVAPGVRGQLFRRRDTLATDISVDLSGGAGGLGGSIGKGGDYQWMSGRRPGEGGMVEFTLYY